jgi:hypothetical protein
VYFLELSSPFSIFRGFREEWGDYRWRDEKGVDSSREREGRRRKHGELHIFQRRERLSDMFQHAVVAHKGEKKWQNFRDYVGSSLVVAA